MPLDWQLAHVVLDSGIDTKSDAKLVTQLTRAENCVWRNPGSVRKRYGVANAANVNAASTRLGKWQQSVLQLDQHKLYLRDGHSNVMGGPLLAKDRIPEVVTTRYNIYQDTFFPSADVDAAATNNVAVAVWDDNNSTNTKIYGTIFNATTGEVLVPATQLNSSLGARAPRCVAVGNSIYVFYETSTFTTITTHSVDTTAGSLSFSGATNIISGTLSLGYFYDVIPYTSTQLVMAWRSSLSTQMRVGLFTASSMANVWQTDLGEDVGSGQPLALAATSPQTIFIAYPKAGAGQIRCAGLTSAGGVKFAPVTVAAVTLNGKIVMSQPSSTRAQVTWDQIPISPPLAIQSRVLDDTGALLGQQQTYPRLNVASAPVVYDGRTYLAIAYTSSVQPSTFVADITDDLAATAKSVRVVASVAPLSGGSVGNARIAQTATGKYLTCIFTGGILFDPLTSNSVDVLTLDLISKSRWQMVELGGSTHISGGQGTSFDGQHVAELGFNVFPDTPTLVASAAGGSMATGNYQYCLVYEYTDTAGNLHLSAPSIPQTAAVTGPTGKVTVTNIQGLTLTARQDIDNAFLPPVLIHLYRTTVNSSGPFYKVTSISGAVKALSNDPTSTSTGTIVDTLADASITSRPTLYTSSGALSNFPPPPNSIMAVHKGCLFCDNTEDGSIWQSKPYSSGFGIGFSSALRLLLPTTERATAMLSMDDKLVIWTKNQIFVAFGEPFDAAGQGNGMTIQPVAADTGCIDWRSVVLGQDGAYFQSPKGIYLLTRGLQLVYVGAPVEYWTNGFTECGGAAMSPDQTEVRFFMLTQASGFSAFTSQVLVLNYQAKSQDAPYGKWSTFNYKPTTGDDMAHATTVGGFVYFAAPNGQTYRESVGSYTDQGAPGGFISTIVETGVVMPAGMQGFVRAKYAQFRLENVASHDLRLEVVTDPDASSSFTQPVNFTDTQIAALPHEQVGVSLIKQLGSGYKFRITDLEPSSAPGTGTEGSRFSGLTLEFGVKRGPRRISAAATG